MPNTVVFDTETSGKWNNKLGVDHPSQPRLVQLGMQRFDASGNLNSEVNLIIKPEGFIIPPDASAVHGITHEYAMKHGIPIKLALSCFKHLIEQEDIVLVAHNISFDLNILQREYLLAGHAFRQPQTFCTMLAMRDICCIPGYKRDEYKWPTLAEAYKHAFGEEVEDAHDAMGDVRSCARIYFHLNPDLEAQPEQVKQAAAPKPSAILTDDSPMPFGKHKGQLMRDVPASYFHWLWCNGSREAKTAVACYIRESLGALKQETPNLIWD